MPLLAQNITLISWMLMMKQYLNKSVSNNMRKGSIVCFQRLKTPFQRHSNCRQPKKKACIVRQSESRKFHLLKRNEIPFSRIHLPSNPRLQGKEACIVCQSKLQRPGFIPGPSDTKWSTFLIVRLANYIPLAAGGVWFQKSSSVILPVHMCMYWK